MKNCLHTSGITTLLTLSILCFPSVNANNVSMAPVINVAKTNHITKNTTVVLSKKEVLAYIKKCHIKFPEFAYKQSLLESGNYKSYLCRKCNNLFGMTFPGKRKTLAIGSCKGYAIYKNWKESVRDYKLWQQCRMKDTVTNYLTFLSTAHYCDSTYSERLSKMFKGKDTIYLTSQQKKS